MGRLPGRADQTIAPVTFPDDLIGRPARWRRSNWSSGPGPVRAAAAPATCSTPPGRSTCSACSDCRSELLLSLPSPPPRTRGAPRRGRDGAPRPVRPDAGGAGRVGRVVRRPGPLQAPRPGGDVGPLGRRRAAPVAARRPPPPGRPAQAGPRAGCAPSRRPPRLIRTNARPAIAPFPYRLPPAMRYTLGPGGDAMPHVVLLGDSIFDNARYVPDGPPVVQHLRRALAGRVGDHPARRGRRHRRGHGRQSPRLPGRRHPPRRERGRQRRHGRERVLREPAVTGGGAASWPTVDRGVRARTTLRCSRPCSRPGGPRPSAPCTTPIPGLGPAEKIGLGLFNEVILRTAFAAGAPVLDLRLICTRTGITRRCRRSSRRGSAGRRSPPPSPAWRRSTTSRHRGARFTFEPLLERTSHPAILARVWGRVIADWRYP